MKKTLFILLFSGFTFFSDAQLSCFFVAGSSHSINLSESSQSGFNVGAILDIPLSRLWSCQTGLNINSIATDSNWDITKTIGGIDKVFDEGSFSKYNFIEIPTTISLKIKLSENANLRFNTGPYLGIYTGGTSLLRTSTGFSDYALIRPYVDPAHLGFLFGTSFEINKFYIGIEGNINTTDYIPKGVIKTKLGIRF